jgi:hypothetical protein
VIRDGRSPAALQSGWRLALGCLRPRLPRPFTAVIMTLCLCGLGWLGWTWYRSSSFVQVRAVRVTGLAGPDVRQIRTALTAAALRMTTLDLNVARLESTVARFGFVQGLAVSSSGPHALTIHVAEQVPVAVAEYGSGSSVVAADGRLLGARAAGLRLPRLPLAQAPTGQTLSAPGARSAVAVLAAAPYTLIPHIANATWSAQHGVVVQLRRGPQLYFGPADELARKWRSAIAVLQSKYSVGASYIVVSDPVHPAAGVGVSPSRAAALGLATGVGG